tara:strand:+ start:261 stop:566 length:306 start_codon:yes stop_codon:yes gene_type:complete
MKKTVSIFILFIFFLLLAGCQTVQKKTESIVKKENKKLSKFIGKDSNELFVELGKPNEDFKNEKGNIEFVYYTKKYLIPCERRFEINSNDIVIGFISNGCF